MNLFQYFATSAENNPNTSALFVDGLKYSYSELNFRVDVIGKSLEELNDGNGLVGFLAHKSLTAYSSVLGILKSGRGYVPLNPKFPFKRNNAILELSKIDTLIVGKEGIESLQVLLKDSVESLNLILDFDRDQLPEEIASKGNLNFVFIDLLNDCRQTPRFEIKKQSKFCYLLFTSGSTGIPKGVPLAHDNIKAYVDYMSERYDINTGDKFSQTFDLTFDLSVHDMFLCWANGGELYCIPEKSLMGPAKFIKEHELNHWFSVPSLAMFMNRFRMLKADAFPSLKTSLFCGEPFPSSLIEPWAKAAQNSILENIYGPTEATIGISHYRCDVKDFSKNKSINGITAIGNVFSSQEYRIVGDDNMAVNEGETGELCLSGSQVTVYYWNNPEATAKSFVDFEGDDKLWYRTGDLVSEDSDGTIRYMSRKDFQVQILGHRVELEEINLVINSLTKQDVCISIPYPVIDGIAQSVYSFILTGSSMEEKELIDGCKRLLAPYMVPKKIYAIDKFPLNVNGKIDRKELQKLI